MWQHHIYILKFVSFFLTWELNYKKLTLHIVCKTIGLQWDFINPNFKEEINGEDQGETGSRV